MKLISKFLMIAVVACVSALISCAGPSGVSYKNVALTLTLSPICTGCFMSGVGTGYFYYQQNPTGAGGIPGAFELPAGGGPGGCPQLTATVTNAPLNPTWAIVPSPTNAIPVNGAVSSNVGTLAQASPGGTNFYCGPNAPAIYTGLQLSQAKAAGLVDATGKVVQGTEMVTVTNPADPLDPTKTVSASIIFTYEVQTPPAGGVSTGINGLPLPANVTVPLGTTYQFDGYVAGINGFGPCQGGNGTGNPATGTPAYSLVYNVNGVPGGAGTGPGQFGTISATGLYTAPAAYPSATVKSAPITVTSLACPTIISPAATVIFP